MRFGNSLQAEVMFFHNSFQEQKGVEPINVSLASIANSWCTGFYMTSVDYYACQSR